MSYKLANKFFKKIQNNNVLNISIIIITATILFGIPIFENTLRWHTDSHFHLSRIHDISESIRHFSLPNSLNMSSFGYSGQAINGMYPYFTLLPFIIITAWMNPISQYATINLLFIIVGSLVNYFVFQKLNKSRSQSLAAVIAIFPIINIFSAYHLSLQGVWAIYFTLPLALLSIKMIYEGQRFYIPLLSMAIATLINIHLVSALIVIIFIFLVFLFLMSQSTAKIKFVINVSYSGLLCIILSAPTLLNLLFFRTSNLTRVNQPLLADNTMSLEQMIHSLSNLPLSGTSTPELYGYVFILDVIIFIFWKFFTSITSKYMVATIIILQLLISPYFPWDIVQHSPINIIQFPNRILPIVIILQILIIFTNSKFNNTKFIVVTSLFALFFAASHVTTNITDKNKMFVVTREMVHRSVFNNNYIDKNISKIDNTVLNDNNFYKLIGYQEYIPTWATKNKDKSDITINTRNNSVIKGRIKHNNTTLLAHKTIIQNDKITYKFDQPQSGSFNLPIWRYKYVNYQVKINGNNVNIKSSPENTLLVHGNDVQSITLKVPNPLSNILGLWLGLVSWSATLIYVFLKRSANKFQ